MLGGSAVVLLLPLLCPHITLQPRPSWVIVAGALFFCLAPFIWSIFLLAIRTTARERVVAYLSLAASLFWLWGAYTLVFFLAGGTHGR